MQDPSGRVRRWLAVLLLAAVLRWTEPETAGEAVAGISTNKVGFWYLRIWAALRCFFLFLCSGRRGDGRREDEGRVSEVARCVAIWEDGVHGLLCAPETVCCGVDQRRPCVAEVIYGERSHSALGCLYPSFFFLQAFVPMRRIFDFGMGFITGIAPSGRVPGSIHGACAFKSPARCGGEEGLEYEFLSLYRVLGEKCEYSL